MSYKCLIFKKMSELSKFQKATVRNIARPLSTNNNKISKLESKKVELIAKIDAEISALVEINNNVMTTIEVYTGMTFDEVYAKVFNVPAVIVPDTEEAPVTEITESDIKLLKEVAEAPVSDMTSDITSLTEQDLPFEKSAPAEVPNIADVAYIDDSAYYPNH